MRKYYFGQNGKLVRNKVLQHCLDDPLVAETCHRFLEPDEHVKLLKEKLREEAEEVIEAVSHEEMIEELADVYEVTLEIMKQQGITQKELLEYQDRKKHEKGTFSDGIFIEHVLLDESSPWNEKFERLPGKYREESSQSRPPLFVTGNQHKADYLARQLGIAIEHCKIELDEIQSTDLQKIVEHKVHQAYNIAKCPVLVEDVALGFDALGGLPGPFIKYFVDTPDGLEKLCRMCDGLDTRGALASCVFGYFDGEKLEFFSGKLHGQIVDHPRGKNGFGWDAIFCPDGFGGKTRAELTPSDDEKTYATIKPFAELRYFLSSSKG